MIRRPFAALALALAGCTAATPTAIPTTPAPTTTSSATPSVSPTRPPVPTAREVVYAAENALWVYDVKTDANRQVARGESVRLPRWVSATQVSYVAGDLGERNTLYLVDLKSQSASALFTAEGGIYVYGWSPDRQTVAYVTTDRYGYPRMIFKTIGGDGATQPVATFARADGREFHHLDQMSIAFSSDGERVLVVFTPADGVERSVPDDQSQLQIRSIDGGLEYAPNHGDDPTMGAWSADGRVYFRSRSGLRVWQPGATSSRAARGGVGWANPYASPDGAFFAFDTGATGTGVKIRTYAVRDGKKTDVTPGGYFRPVVPNPKTVWAQRVTPCRPDCPMPVVAAPEVWAFDIATKKSKKLALPTLIDVDIRFA